MIFHRPKIALWSQPSHLHPTTPPLWHAGIIGSPGDIWGLAPSWDSTCTLQSAKPRCTLSPSSSRWCSVLLSVLLSHLVLSHRTQEVSRYGLWSDSLEVILMLHSTFPFSICIIFYNPIYSLKWYRKLAISNWQHQSSCFSVSTFIMYTRGKPN